MKVRDFEKISFEQFKRDIIDDYNLYLDFRMPKRSTKNSAGYDFIAIKDFSIKPDEIIRIPTGYKFYCKENEVLLIVVRSSMGFKYNIRMTNQVGVIDRDYYNNSNNEGHMWVSLKNEGTKEYNVKKGEAYAQGIITSFLNTDSDDASDIRTGGIGSTNKKEGN